MGDRRCCCLECLFYTDDFGRANSTDIGVYWREEVGDWEIDTERLVEGGTNPASAIYLRYIPNTPGAKSSSTWAPYMQVAVRFFDEANGDVFCVYGFYKNDQNYIKGTYTRVDADNATVAIYQCIGGVEQLLHSNTFELTDKVVASRSVSLCITDTYMFLMTDDTSGCYAVHETVIISGGHYSGVGHENDLGATFDDFSVIQLYKPDEVCYPCAVCDCEGIAPAPQLFMTYEGDGATDCDTLDGVTVELNTSLCGQPPIFWTGVLNDGCMSGVNADITLTCNGTGAVGWQLDIEVVVNPACTPSSVNLTLYSLPGSTCDPFNLIFEVSAENPEGAGSWCPENCRPCGDGGGAENPKLMHYYIYITE